MILVLAVVLGLLASLVRHRGCTFQRIAALRLHWASLALLAVVLQVPLLRAPMDLVRNLRVQQALFLASYLLLLVFVWRNRRLAGILIVGVGVVLNLLAIVANRGFMPITTETLVEINPGSTPGQWPEGFHYGFSKDVIHARQDTKLWALSDILVVSPPFPWPMAFSVGDLVLAFGIVVLLQGSPART